MLVIVKISGGNCHDLWLFNDRDADNVTLYQQLGFTRAHAKGLGKIILIPYKEITTDSLMGLHAECLQSGHALSAGAL